MALKVCPQCGYRYNAPENQTCGKCKGWLGGVQVAAATTAAPRRSLVPANPREALCYLPIPLGALWGWPNPIGAAFGILMGALLIKVVRLDMERFSKTVLIGIVITGILLAYLIFLVIFQLLLGLAVLILQTVRGH